MAKVITKKKFIELYPNSKENFTIGFKSYKKSTHISNCYSDVLTNMSPQFAPSFLDS